MTPQERLTEARAALHDLLIGRSVAEVTDQNGEKIRYRSAEIGNLRQYIIALEAEVAGVPAASGPMRFWGRS